MIRKVYLFTLLFLVSFVCTAVNDISAKRNIESLTKEIRNLNLEKSGIDETRIDFNYFLNLAINNRTDLKTIKQQLISGSYTNLSNSSLEKLKSVIEQIKIRYQKFITLLKQRKSISDNYQDIVENLSELEAAYNRKLNISKINSARKKLKQVRKHLIQKEKKLAKARLELYQNCGIPAEALKRPSTATINQAQSDYVKAQKSYIKSVLGISDNKAELNSAIGTPIY